MFRNKTKYKNINENRNRSVKKINKYCIYMLYIKIQYELGIEKIRYENDSV